MSKICTDCELTNNNYAKITQNIFPPSTFLPSPKEIIIRHIKMGNKYANRFVFYYAAESKNQLQKDNKFNLFMTEKQAYDDFENSGIVKLDLNGNSKIILSNPIQYFGKAKEKYEKHIHFRISNLKNTRWEETEYTMKLNHFDIIIVGAGIAGLYSAYKLANNYNILIIEKNHFIGGRIFTFKSKINNKININYEAGAGRFSENHKLLIKLIEDFDLDNKIIKLSNKKLNLTEKYNFNCKNKNINNEYNLHKSITVSKLLNKVIKLSEKISRQYLQTITFFNLCNNLLKYNECKFIDDFLGYKGELHELNAYDAIRMFNIDFNLNNQFYSLKDGLRELILKLSYKLEKNYDVIFNLKTEVLDFEFDKKNKYFNVFAKNELSKEKFTCEKLILATNKDTLLGFSELKPINHELNSVIGNSLHRIYALYPKNKDGKVWFHNINKITTPNRLQYIIPIDIEKGIIMISYTDYDNADYWKKIKDDKNLDKEIHLNLKKLFPKLEIPKPIFLKSHYWKNGVYYYKPGYNSDEISKKIIKPFVDKDLFIVGECYSQNQAWIEGALVTVNNMLKQL